jgi:hypothetical protein
MIEGDAREYYAQADPRSLRNGLNLFKAKNRAGQPTAANLIEVQAHHANAGDPDFGRDMHCRCNVASDTQFDYACYVTNFGEPLPGAAALHGVPWRQRGSRAG